MFRAVKRAGVTGPTHGRGGPPNPAVAGNNFMKLCPLPLNVFEKESPREVETGKEI